MKQIILTIMILLLSSNSWAEVPKAQAIRGIIGEASDQGERGMLAVACAIRNRGTLKGVYGVNAKHVDKQPKWVWDRAEKVWEQSATIDITNGSTHWESIKFKKPYWADSMIKAVLIGDHQFYKSK